MAVLVATGLEAQQGQLDNATLNATAAYSTAQARTGSASVRCNPASNAAGYVQFGYNSAKYAHFGLYIASLPSITRIIAGTASGVNLRLSSTGALSFYDRTTLVGTAASSLNTGQWYWIGVRDVAGTNVDLLQVDGTTVLNGTLSSLTSYLLTYGAIATNEASALDIYIDDLINDDAGFLAPSNVALLLPVTDSYNYPTAMWTGGAGGTINVYRGAKNTPPAGVPSASETDTTNIECADKNGLSDYQMQMTAYETAGIVADDTVLYARVVIQHGEDISTGTKTGQFAVANPTIGWYGFTFGSDAGQHGSTPTGWSVTMQDVGSPTINVASSATVYLQKTDTTSRVGCVDFAGLYVAWTPAATGEKFATAADTISSLSDSVARDAMAKVRTIAETFGSLSESVAALKLYVRTVAQTLGTVTDAIVRSAMAKVRTTSDSTTVTESIARSAMAKVRTVPQTLGTVSESVGRHLDALRTGGDTVGSLTEAVARAAANRVRTIAETFGSLSEVVEGVKSGAQQVVATVEDAITLTETVARTAASKVRTVSESSLSVTESIVRTAAAKVRTLAETVSLSEAATALKLALRTMGDTITLSETAVRGAFAKVRTVSDSSTVSEAVARVSSVLRTTSETATSITESLVRGAASKVRTLADSSTVTEAIARVSSLQRTLSDSAAISEVVAGTKVLLRTLSDVVTLSEAVGRAAFNKVRTAAETATSITENAARAAIAFIRREHRPSDDQ